MTNPLRGRRFAQADLEQTKADAIATLGLLRFGAEKRPAVTRAPNAATDELRELVRVRDRIMQDLSGMTACCERQRAATLYQADS